MDRRSGTTRRATGPAREGGRLTTPSAPQTPQQPVRAPVATRSAAPTVPRTTTASWGGLPPIHLTPDAPRETPRAAPARQASTATTVVTQPVPRQATTATTVVAQPAPRQATTVTTTATVRPSSEAPQRASATVQAPRPSATPAPAPLTQREIIARGYPLGFRSLEEFRDATRVYAQQDRSAIVFVSGSSVTNRSYRTGRPFRETSDIDIGLASHQIATSGQVDERGFPRGRTSIRNAELYVRRQNYAHPMGVRVYDAASAAEAVPDRAVIIRDHTPEPRRGREIDTRPPRSGGRGRRF